MSLQRVKAYPLSDAVIRAALGNDVKIFTYPELNQLRHIDQCFDTKGRCILLYLTVSNSAGHWVCMLKKGSTIEYFDSYGEPPEQPLTELPTSKLQQLGQTDSTLMMLFKASGYKVYYNTFPFQQDRAGVATCGRHCVARLLYAPKSLEQYYSIVKSSGLTPDNFVSGLVYDALHK